MIGLDTNVLARFYVDDPNDPQAAEQRLAARRLLTESPKIFVPLTVVLELEWILRAFYGFAAQDFVKVVRHLLGLPNVTVEGWTTVSDALTGHEQGLDFADALHLLASQRCTAFATFDDRRFARRANRLGITPPVVVPQTP